MMVAKNNLVSNEMNIQSTHKIDKNNINNNTNDNNKHKQQQDSLSNGYVLPTTFCVYPLSVLSIPFARMHCYLIYIFSLDIIG